MNRPFGLGIHPRVKLMSRLCTSRKGFLSCRRTRWWSKGMRCLNTLLESNRTRHAKRSIFVVPRNGSLWALTGGQGQHGPSTRKRQFGDAEAESAKRVLPRHFLNSSSIPLSLQLLPPAYTLFAMTVEPSNDKPEKLPPGMVLGPDGKPCKICTAFRYWKPRKGAPQAKGQDAGNSARVTNGTSAGVTGAAAAGVAYGSSDHTRPEYCPPDVEQLGRATWTFLHTTAAYYPDNPTPNQRSTMLSLLNALPTLYPCTHCATHLGQNMVTHPPDVSSRTTLSRWLCERHNDVNKVLGKKSFNCAINSLDERWKDGPADGSCD